MIQRGRVGSGVAQRGVVRVEKIWEGEGEGKVGFEVMGKGRDRRVRREMSMGLRRRGDMMVEVGGFLRDSQEAS